MLTRALELTWCSGRGRLGKKATRLGFIPARRFFRQGKLAIGFGPGQLGVKRHDAFAQAVVKVLLAEALDECRCAPWYAPGAATIRYNGVRPAPRAWSPCAISMKTPWAPDRRASRSATSSIVSPLSVSIVSISTGTPSVRSIFASASRAARTASSLNSPVVSRRSEGTCSISGGNWRCCFWRGLRSEAGRRLEPSPAAGFPD